jgi:hypothetical protein
MIEVIENPVINIFEILIFAIGLTAITFIAIILYLDLQEQKEPVSLPDQESR